MKQYILTILIVSIVGGMLSSLVSNKNEQIKKQINFLIGLICALVLLSPLVDIVNNTSKIENKIESFTSQFDSTPNTNIKQDIVITTGIEKIEDSIKYEIVKNYKIKEESVNVDIILNEEKEITIKSVLITLTNDAIWLDENSIIEFTENLVGVKVTIIKKWG